MRNAVKIQQKCIRDREKVMKRYFSKMARMIRYARCLSIYSWRFGRWGKRTLIGNPDKLTNPRAINLGDRVEIRKGARLEAVGPWDGKRPKITIGDNTSIHFYFHCGAAKSVRIGNDVLIAGRVYISDHDHQFDDSDLPPIYAGWKVAEVVIGDGVWIGEGAVILRGVTVGKRAVIGANAVVTKDVAPYTLVGGVPAKLIREIYLSGKKHEA
jgi:acetyltransferase-like isoleucine patch superfamily enzyme